jgi:subtilisin family serine protease
MIRRVWFALVAAAACGCSHAPAQLDVRDMNHDATLAPERFIIAAVDNQPVNFVARAGGTPRPYDDISGYGPSIKAEQVMRAVEQDYGLREVNAWPIQALHIHCAVLEIPAGADRTALLAKLAQDRRIKLTQPLQTFATRTEAYNDPYVDLQRGFRQMDVSGAHPFSRGEGVKIAVIDTGADTDHPDLQGNIAAAANFVDADAAQFKRDRHGTEIAGVLAAVANNKQGIVGVAPAARLLIYKACWQVQADADAARCNSFTLARALAAAFDAHAQIVNMSLAGPSDPLVGDLIREGQHRGVLFVGAAGAESGLTHQPDIIEVASMERTAEVSTALYAPGSEILTLLPGARYDFASGTSIATAQVSGVLALLLAKNPSLSAAQALALLRDTSFAASASGGELKRVDACAAVIKMLQKGNCAPLGIDDAPHDADTRVAQH